MKTILVTLFVLTAFVRLSAQNQNISNGLFFDGEPYLVIDPANSQHLVVAWMGYTFGNPLGIKTRVSFNGGTSWSAPKTLPHFSPTYHSADPSLAFDPADGTLYACYIDYRENPDSGGVYVLRSNDGGLNWGNAVKAIDAYADGNKRPLDRPWLTINPVNGHLYITTKPAPWIAPPNRPYFMCSTDGGQNWQPWQYLDGPGFLTGNFIAGPMAAPATSSDGYFHAVFPSWVPSQNILPGFIHARSSDDGNNFTYHGMIYAAASGPDTLAKTGYRLVADPSDPTHLVFTYTFKSNGGDLDIFILESFNSGNTWSNPVRVNNDPIGNGKMQDLVWADFDDDGDLVLGWRDRRNGTGNGYENASEIWGAVRWKGTPDFSPNFRISDTITPYNGLYLSQNGNDFMCLDMKNDTLYAVWGDVRMNKLNIWFARKALASGASNTQLLVDEPVPFVNIFPNPAQDLIRFEGSSVLDASLYDLSGRLLLQTKPVNNQLSLQHLPSQTLILLLHTAEGDVVKRIEKK